MARRKKGQPIHGWLLLDKPLALGSTPAVSRVRHLFDAQKAGHAGTLDPLATGLLPIALGEATKTLPYLLDADKTYQFEVTFGTATATDDREGEVVARSDVRPTAEQIRAILPQFTGSIMQTPPAYSALHIDGERAYARVRRGEVVEMPSRNVHIRALTLLSTTPETAMFEASVSKGTYIRSLGRDIALALGSVGHITLLRRTALAGMQVADAVPLETLQAAADPFVHLQPVAMPLGHWAKVSLSDAQAAALKNGHGPLLPQQQPGPCCAYSATGTLLALLDVPADTTQPAKILRRFIL